MQVEENSSSATENQYQEPIKLKYYQQDAVDAITKAIELEQNIALLIMAVGKGQVISHAILFFSYIRKSTLIVGTNEHKKQLSMEVNALGSLSAPFDIITYQEFTKKQEIFSNSDIYYLVDLQSKAAINASQLIRNNDKNARIIITTPSPSLELVEYVDRNIIYEYSIAQAMADDYYLPVKVIQPSVHHELNTTSVVVDDIQKTIISHALINEQLGHWLSQVKISNGDKVIIFCQNITEAGHYFQALNSLLSNVNDIVINTSLITSKNNEYADLIGTFQNDKSAHIALSVNLLLEKVESLPKVNHIVNFKRLSQNYLLVALVARPFEGKSFGTIWDYAGLNWSDPRLGVHIENTQLSATNIVYRIEPKGDQENGTDLLGRGTLVHVLKGIIESDSKFKPFTVGLFGKWGTGKSTIINLLRQSFEANPNYHFSIFNAWENEHCDFMAGALAHHLATDLYSKQSLLKRTYMLGKYRVFLQKDTLKNTLMWWMLIGIAALTVISTGVIDRFLEEGYKSQIIVSGIVSGFAITIFGIAKNLWASPFLKKINAISNSPDYSKHLGVAQYLKEDIRALIDSYSFSAQHYFEKKFSSLFNSKKNELPDNTQNIGRKIILVIEDLDRCSPDRIVNTLEAIRLLASLDNVIVVFAVDGEQLLNAVALKSLNSFIDQTQSQQIARNFLGKLFQLVIELDEPNPSQLSKFIQKRLYDSIEVETEVTDSFKRSEHLKKQAKEEALNEFKVDWEEAEYEEDQASDISDLYLKSTLAEVEYFTLLTGLFKIGNPRTLIRLHNSVTLLKGLFPVLISNNEKLKEHMFFLFLNEIYTIDIPIHALDIPQFFDSLNGTNSSRDRVIRYHYQQDIESSDSNTLQLILNRVRKVSIPHIKC